jgi:hypothetical protein
MQKLIALIIPGACSRALPAGASKKPFAPLASAKPHRPNHLSAANTYAACRVIREISKHPRGRQASSVSRSRVESRQGLGDYLTALRSVSQVKEMGAMRTI